MNQIICEPSGLNPVQIFSSWERLRQVYQKNDEDLDIISLC